MSDPTRGERNNNPGNLNFIEANPWQGQIGLELVPPDRTYTPRFGRYDTIENGIRAVAKQLLAYQHKHGDRTVRQFVQRWAPPNENMTNAYVEDVANALGCGEDDDVDLGDAALLATLTRAIIKHENGRCLYDAALIADAAQQALGPTQGATA